MGQEAYVAAGTAGYLGLLAGLGVFLFVIFAIAIVFYVLFAIGLKKMADDYGLENSWLAWVPIAQLYILGKLVGEIELFGQKIPYTEWILIGGCFVNIVPVIGQILSFLVGIYSIVVLYNLYKLYSKGNEVLYTVLTVVIWIAPILVFIIRNNERQEIQEIQG